METYTLWETQYVKLVVSQYMSLTVTLSQKTVSRSASSRIFSTGMRESDFDDTALMRSLDQCARAFDAKANAGWTFRRSDWNDEVILWKHSTQGNVRMYTRAFPFDIKYLTTEFLDDITNALNNPRFGAEKTVDVRKYQQLNLGSLADRFHECQRERANAPRRSSHQDEESRRIRLTD